MLIAVSQTNEYYPASRASKKEKYFCPACRQGVVLRRGGHNVDHFAHQSKVTCTGGLAEGESLNHLLGKIALAEYYQKYGKVQIEPILGKIQQRPDLVLRRLDNSPLAIEYQCSPLGAQRLAERNFGYQSLGYDVLWVLGPEYYHRHLSTALICRYWRNGQICFYLPKEKHFVVFSNFYKIDFQRVRFHRQIFANPAFEQLIPTMVSGPIDEGTPDFVRQRAKLTLLLAQKRVDVDLVAYLYQKGWRLDQIPTWCLLGRQFGLVVPNWHLRLVLILLLMNSAKKCLAISALNQRLERYFHPNYQKDCRQVALVNLYQELEKVGGIKVIDGQIIVKKLPSFVSE